MIYLITGNDANDATKDRVEHALLSLGCVAKISPLLKHTFLVILPQRLCGIIKSSNNTLLCRCCFVCPL